MQDNSHPLKKQKEPKSKPMTKGIQRKRNKWVAYFFYEGIRVVVGHFKTKERAKEELKKAVREGKVDNA